MTKADLIKLALSVTGKFNSSKYCSSGSVGAAILTSNNNIFTGICIDTSCGIGFCAEHSAIAEMLKNKESEIKMIVAIDENGIILPPCGRCRELILSIKY